MRLIKNAILHNYTGSSDKLYIISLYGNGKDNYYFLSSWGKVGKAGRVSYKGRYSMESLGLLKLYQLKGLKERNGYREIGGFNYSGKLKIDDKEVGSLVTKAEDYLRNFLTDNGLEIKSVDPIKKPIRKPIEKVLQKDEDKGCEDIESTDELKVEYSNYIKNLNKHEIKSGEAKCVDNKGIEDLFDVGVVYIYEGYKEEDMVWVYDRFGNRGEYFKDRFIII